MNKEMLRMKCPSIVTKIIAEFGDFENFPDEFQQSLIFGWERNGL